MRAEFYRPDNPHAVVGVAAWSGGGVEISAEDDSVRESVRRIFRPTPVAIDNPSLRSFGTSGPVLLSPGTLRWFRAAAESRATGEGLRIRFVPESGGAIGWDPAGAYRTFVAATDRMARVGASETRAGAPRPSSAAPNGS